MKDRREEITRFAWGLLLLLLFSAVDWQEARGLARSLGGAVAVQIPPIVSIGDVTVVEGHSGTRPMVFQVRLNTTSTQTVRVSYKTAADTALAHLDYVQASGLLIFTPGQVRQTITIQVIGDVLYEGDEIFYVTLVHAQNALIGDGIGQATIIDDDNGFFLPVVNRS